MSLDLVAIKTDEIAYDIRKERLRQFNKWGQQDHDEDRWMVAPDARSRPCQLS